MRRTAGEIGNPKALSLHPNYASRTDEIERVSRRMRGDSKKLDPSRFARMQWDPSLRERKTAPDYIATSLRTAIYDGQFADDEELNQVELAAFFGVSRVPIREALRQLQAEGLVRSVAHYRAVVRGLSLDEILEAIEMRAVLEAHLLERAAPHLRKEDFDHLQKFCQEGEAIKSYGSRWVLKNWQFHRAIYHRAAAPLMVETVEKIALNVERYARRAGSPERLETAVTEHWSIYRALRKGNIEAAARGVKDHVLNTGREIARERAARAKDAVLPSSKNPRRRRTVTASDVPSAIGARKRVGRREQIGGNI